MDYHSYFLVLAILGSFLTLEVQSVPEHNPSEDEITEVELLDKAPASKNVSDSKCEPFSQAACIASAISMGYEVGNVNNSGGYTFAGPYRTKGCYAYPTGIYEGLVFYGTGGSKEKMQDQVVQGKFRPQGYDCNECPTGWWFIEGKCYLYKNVDKRKAKLVTEKEVCNGGTCPKPADDKNSTDSDSICDPYSKEACMSAALSMGYKLGNLTNSGYNFSGIYATKGCYGYPNGVFKGLVFYGLGGSEEDMQDQVTNMQGRIRPQGYDCNECPTGWWFLKGNCYLFKKVDKRNAKLIQDCTDEESCANPDSEKNLADLKAKIISKFKSKLALLSTTTQSPSSNPNLDTEISTVETESVAKSLIGGKEETTDKETVPESNPKVDSCGTSGRKFDALSFFGGIILTVGIAGISFAGYKYYQSRGPKPENYNLM